jgi:flagellar export protein FliJ
LKTFSFKLHALLRLKESRREHALAQFASSTRELQRLKLDLTNAQNKRDAVLVILNKRQTGTFQSAEIQSLQTSLHLERENISRIEKKVTEANRILESRRKIFLEKDSQFKAVQRLRETQRDAHYVKENKKEETELEDVISSRFLFHRINHQS